MNETKYTVRLDDKSVLAINDLHRGLISDQKLALEEYKLEQTSRYCGHCVGFADIARLARPNQQLPIQLTFTQIVSQKMCLSR